MGHNAKRIPVLTPAYGRKYKTREDCLHDYINGAEFVYNMDESKLDGCICTINNLYYEVVMLRFGSQSFIYEGNWWAHTHIVESVAVVYLAHGT